MDIVGTCPKCGDGIKDKGSYFRCITCDYECDSIKTPNRHQWEYRVERPGSIDDESMALLLNSLGESGWEYAGSYGNVMIFKRLKLNA